MFKHIDKIDLLITEEVRNYTATEKITIYRTCYESELKYRHIKTLLDL